MNGMIQGVASRASLLLLLLLVVVVVVVVREEVNNGAVGSKIPHCTAPSKVTAQWIEYMQYIHKQYEFIKWKRHYMF